MNHGPLETQSLIKIPFFIYTLTSLFSGPSFTEENDEEETEADDAKENERDEGEEIVEVETKMAILVEEDEEENEY